MYPNGPSEVTSADGTGSNGLGKEVPLAFADQSESIPTSASWMLLLAA